MAKNEVDQLANQMWGLSVAQGVFAILFGIAALFWPGVTLIILAVIFGIYMLVWGITDMIRSLMGIGKVSFWWLELIFSILTIGVGVYLLRHTAVTLGVLILLMGFTFIIRGIIDFVTGLFSKDEEVKSQRVFYILGGIFGILAGIIVLNQPIASGVAFVWIVGLYAILQGSLIIAMSLKARALAE